MKLARQIGMPFLPCLLIVIITAQLLVDTLIHGLIIEVYVNTTNVTASSVNTRRRMTSRSLSSIVSYNDLTNSTDDETNDDDWQTIYDANVTVTPGAPLLNLSSIQFVLVGIDQASSVSTNVLGQSDSTTASRTRASATSTLITRQIETYFKGTATSRRAVASNRQETIWHGSLRDPANVTVEEEQFNTNPSIFRQWRQKLTSYYRNKKRTKTPEVKIDRIGFCTVLEINGLIRSATFTTETDVYDLIYLYDTQQYQIRASSWGDFPPENDIHSEPSETPINNRRTTNYFNPLPNIEFDTVPIQPQQQTTSNTQQTYNSTKKDIGSGRYVSISLHQGNEWEMIDDGPMKVINSDHDGTQNTNRRTQTTAPFTTVEVLVVVTNRGLCEFISKTTPCATTATNRAPMDNRLKLAEAETNNALQSINVQIRIIKVVYFSSASNYDPVSDTDGMNSIDANSDIQSLRETNYADLVAVVAGNGGGSCGIGTIFGYRSVTAQGCLGQYTLSHEIGHNFGGNHNREAMSSWPSPYAYAYRREYQYRTFLSYSCDTSPGCPRIPYYSSSTLKLSDGRILGNSTNDNLRLIKIQAPAVSRFRVSPTPRPTIKPTNRPTRRPTRVPTRRPTRQPTRIPTRRPTRIPTRAPTRRPTSVPTRRPTAPPTRIPTRSPTRIPTRSPTRSPTNAPTRKPTNMPTNVPTNMPTNKPTSNPTVRPTSKPTVSNRPSRVPSEAPSAKPTISMSPTTFPSAQPSERPTISDHPSSKPSSKPSNKPSSNPSNKPSNHPSKQPSNRPSRQPSSKPSNQPSKQPSKKPSSRPSSKPSRRPSSKPSSRPSSKPSRRPSTKPSKSPSRIPSTRPSSAPSSSPTQRRTTCFDTCKNGTGNLMYRKTLFWAMTKRCLVRCVDEVNYQIYALLGFRCGLSCKTSTTG